MGHNPTGGGGHTHPGALFLVPTPAHRLIFYTPLDGGCVVNKTASLSKGRTPSHPCPAACNRYTKSCAVFPCCGWSCCCSFWVPPPPPPRGNRNRSHPLQNKLKSAKIEISGRESTPKSIGIQIDCRTVLGLGLLVPEDDGSLYCPALCCSRLNITIPSLFLVRVVISRSMLLLPAHLGLFRGAVLLYKLRRAS